MAKIPPKNSPKSAAKPGKDTIYIDAEDEITAIIDKVEGAKQKVVALVLPKRAATLQSIVNMRLLKRSATSAGKNVVLITSEHALLPLAGAAGLHVAKNLQSKPEIPPPPHGATPTLDAAEEVAGGELSGQELDEPPQKLDYSKPIGELAGKHEEPEEITLDDEDSEPKPAEAAAAATTAKKTPKGKGLKVPDFDRFRLLLFGGIAALIALIVFIFLAVKVLPHAKITVKTTSTPVSLDTTLTASGSAKQLDEAGKVIPSILKTSDQTANAQVNATGQKNLGNTASGSVTFSLKDCSRNQVTIPAGTGISTNGISFITQSSATLQSVEIGGSCQNNSFPGASSKTVDITAQSPGAKYNVSNASFSISGVSGASSVSANGSADGGTDKNVTIVTQQDVDGAKKEITSEDSDKFSKDFQNKLRDDGYYVITSTLKIGEPNITSTPKIGEQASSASVTVKITYSVLVVQKSDLENFVKDALNKQIDKKKEKLSDTNVLDGLSVTVQSQQANSPNATLSLSKDSAAVPILDEDAIKAQIKGKKESQIRSYLTAYPGVKEVEVDFSPFWVSKVPNNTGKIKIVEQQQLKGQ